VEKKACDFALLFIQNNLRNGFFEEFLFRGALMSRLNLLFGRSWGVVLATLIFGLFHAPTYTAVFQGDLLAGIAYSMVNPVVFGLCFAIIVLPCLTTKEGENTDGCKEIWWNLHH
jgi:membrane protease YdiL (CAAX protease family)